MAKRGPKPKNKITIDKGIETPNPIGYSIYAKCSNCELYEKILIPYGVIVCDKRCPKCRCTTLKIVPNPINLLTNFTV
jgi:hypothetical protein